MHAAGFQDIAHARAGLHARARTGRHQDYSAAAKPADDPMRDCFPFELDLPAAAHGILCILDRFFDAGGDFVGLAVAPADLAFAVADDDESRKAEPATALDHRGAALDLNGLVDVFTPEGVLMKRLIQFTPGSGPLAEPADQVEFPERVRAVGSSCVHDRHRGRARSNC